MGKFIVKNTATGIKFDLLATNGQVIATSEVYSQKASCLKGIASVKTNAVAAQVSDTTLEEVAAVKNPKFEVYLDKAGEYRFRLTAKNGQIIAVSEGYKTKVNCMKGVASVQKNAPEAPIEEK